MLDNHVYEMYIPTIMHVADPFQFPVARHSTTVSPSMLYPLVHESSAKLPNVVPFDAKYWPFAIAITPQSEIVAGKHFTYNDTLFAHHCAKLSVGVLCVHWLTLR